MAYPLLKTDSNKDVKTNTGENSPQYQPPQDFSQDPNNLFTFRETQTRVDNFLIKVKTTWRAMGALGYFLALFKVFNSTLSAHYKVQGTLHDFSLPLNELLEPLIAYSKTITAATTSAKSTIEGTNNPELYEDDYIQKLIERDPDAFTYQWLPKCFQLCYKMLQDNTNPEIAKKTKQALLDYLIYWEYWAIRRDLADADTLELTGKTRDDFLYDRMQVRDHFLQLTPSSDEINTICYLREEVTDLIPEWKRYHKTKHPNENVEQQINQQQQRFDFLKIKANIKQALEEKQLAKKDELADILAKGTHRAYYNLAILICKFGERGLTRDQILAIINGENTNNDDSNAKRFRDSIQHEWKRTQDEIDEALLPQLLAEFENKYNAICSENCSTTTSCKHKRKLTPRKIKEILASGDQLKPQYNDIGNQIKVRRQELHAPLSSIKNELNNKLKEQLRFEIETQKNDENYAKKITENQDAIDNYVKKQIAYRANLRQNCHMQKYERAAVNSSKLFIATIAIILTAEALFFGEKSFNWLFVSVFHLAAPGVIAMFFLVALGCLTALLSNWLFSGPHIKDQLARFARQFDQLFYYFKNSNSHYKYRNLGLTAVLTGFMTFASRFLIYMVFLSLPFAAATNPIAIIFLILSAVASVLLLSRTVQKRLNNKAKEQLKAESKRNLALETIFSTLTTFFAACVQHYQNVPFIKRFTKSLKSTLYFAHLSLPLIPILGIIAALASLGVDYYQYHQNTDPNKAKFIPSKKTLSLLQLSLFMLAVSLGASPAGFAMLALLFALTLYLAFQSMNKKLTTGKKIAGLVGIIIAFASAALETFGDFLGMTVEGIKPIASAIICFFEFVGLVFFYLLGAYDAFPKLWENISKKLDSLVEWFKTKFNGNETPPAKLSPTATPEDSSDSDSSDHGSDPDSSDPESNSDVESSSRQDVPRRKVVQPNTRSWCCIFGNRGRPQKEPLSINPTHSPRHS